LSTFSPPNFRELLYLFGFQTPASFREINYQNELTFHNIGILQKTTDYLLIVGSACGLVGVCLNFYPRFKKISIPIILSTWFLTILAMAAISLLISSFAGTEQAGRLKDIFAETNEFLLGFAGYLYIFLNGRKLSYGRLRNVIIQNYEITSSDIIVSFSNTRIVFLPINQIPFLINQPQSILENVQLQSQAKSLFWPDLDSNLSIDQILGGGPII